MEKHPEKRPIISEATLIPVSFMLIIIVGVVRVESIGSKADASTLGINSHEQQIARLQDEDKQIRQQIRDSLEALNTRLARMEGALGIKDK